jgi:hypothetical protein
VERVLAEGVADTTVMRMGPATHAHGSRGSLDGTTVHVSMEAMCVTQRDHMESCQVILFDLFFRNGPLPNLQESP